MDVQNKISLERLRDLGLGKNEAEAYIALMEYGEGTVLDISRRCSVHRVNLYDALNLLKRKGLVSELKKEDTTIFKPNEPEALLSFIQSKEQDARDIIPNLRKTFETHENNAQIFFGLQGVKHILLDMIRDKNTIYAFGIPKTVPDLLSDFLKTFHRNRIKNKIHIYHIYNESAAQRIDFLNKIKYSKAKHLGSKYDVPATTIVYGDKVAFWIFSSEIFCIVIKSKVMAQSYKKYFDILWKLSK